MGAFQETAFAQSREWTVLVYWAVDNDLYEYSLPYLDEFKKLTPKQTASTSVLLHYDYPGTRLTERMVLNSGRVRGFSVAETLPIDQDSADPKTLQEFIAWGAKNFPAKRYALVIGSHGSNWSGLIEDVSTWNYMSLQDFANVLTASPVKMNLLVFDTCNMSFLETLHVLKDTAEVMVGSPYFLNGFNHKPPLRLMGKKPDLPTEEYAKKYVSAYPLRKGNIWEKDLAASALRLKDTAPFVAKFETFLAELNLQDRSKLLELYRKISKSIDGTDLETGFDLFELVNRAGKFSKSLRVKADELIKMNPWVISTSQTLRTRNHSGVSLTCTMDVASYATMGLGKVLPSWNQLCTLWNQVHPVIPTPVPSPSHKP